MKIKLIYISKVGYGGFPSYTEHLRRSFIEMGYDTEIVKIGNNTERKSRTVKSGMTYRNYCFDDVVDMVRCDDTWSLITCTYWKDFHQRISDLMELGAEVVIHDHTDMRNEFRDFMIEIEARPVVIRAVNQTNLENVGVPAVFIQHPYIPLNPKPPEDILYNAVSFARLDYDKYSHFIVLANDMLPEDQWCHMFGSGTHKYIDFVLKKKYPTYKTYYHGVFDGADYFQVRMASQCNFQVDMSAIKSDGGGTQYTFLEAWDAGAVLVVNRAWLIGADDTLTEGWNCVAAEDENELMDILCDEPFFDDRDWYRPVIENGRSLLSNHVPEVVIPRYVRYFEDYE